MPAPERADTTFASGGESCAAWLYLPEGEGPHPCVVMAHGFSATRDQRLDAYAERFQAAGLAALVFDYRHFGASSGEPRQLVSIGRQLADWRAAVAHARNLAEIDARRVAIWGSSFSGGHVIAIAAGDPSIAAVVSQAPFTDGLSAIRAGGAKAALTLTLEGLKDVPPMLTGGEPHTIPAVAQPGGTAFMSSPEAKPGFEGITAPESPWENRVSARAGLALGGYRPYAKFGKLRMPVLVIVCDNDTTTPPEPAARAAEKSPNAELKRYPVGHFDVYVEPQFETAVADQTDFLVRNLVGDQVPAPA
jgi:uncharacterized protein